MIIIMIVQVSKTVSCVSLVCFLPVSFFINCVCLHLCCTCIVFFHLYAAKFCFRVSPFVCCTVLFFVWPFVFFCVSLMLHPSLLPVLWMFCFMLTSCFLAGSLLQLPTCFGNAAIEHNCVGLLSWCIYVSVHVISELKLKQTCQRPWN